MNSKVSKIVLIGIMGNGKSSVANLFAGKEIFKVSNGADSCTLQIESYINGDIQIFDTEGLNSQKNNDIRNLQTMISRFRKEEMNAIFIVHNGEICRIDYSLKNVIRQICNLFIGKYIWNQIGIIFTHYGYDEEDQKEIKGREKEFVKKILKVAEEEYEEIIKNQDENHKTCDSSLKLVDTLKCFYVNAKKKKNKYDDHTLQQIEEIKKLVRTYPPITKVQSKFITKKEYRRDMKGDIKTILKTQKEKGIVAGLKKAGCYGIGVFEGIYMPVHYINGAIFKGIGLAFDNNRFNKAGDIFLNVHNVIPKFFTELPEEVLNTEITGSETHYELFDLEITYYSNGEVENKIINIRPQVIQINKNK